jgi:hypothetical protein
VLSNGALEGITFSFWDSWQPPTGPSGFGFDTAPFNTSVMFQSIGARLIGLTQTQPRLRYHIETFARDADGFRQLIDRVPATGSLEYNVLNPALAPINMSPLVVRSRPLFLDVDGGQITGAVNLPVLTARGHQPLLILHHHNMPTGQAEVVDVRSAVTVGGNSERVFSMLLPIVDYH